MITVAMGRGTVDGVVGVCRETGVGCGVAVTNGEYEVGGSRDGCGSAEKTEGVGVGGVVGGRWRGGGVVGLRGLPVGGTVDIRWVLEAGGGGWVSGRVSVGFSGGCKIGKKGKVGRMKEGEGGMKEGV